MKPATKRAAEIAADSPERSPSSGWIISGFWDSVLFIGAPVTCILTLLPLSRYWRSQDYSFFLLAFVTFGHHLPGFLRAYGDRELFLQYRVRFLLAPPLIFLATLWFDLRGLHGLIIFVFAWDIWHVLMQHYGFMRIYDAKRGEINPLTARMDRAVSVCWYLSLIAASPHYRQNLLSQAYGSGVPIFPVAAFAAIETGLYGLTAIASAAYIAYNLRLWKQGRLCPRKLVLLSTFLGASYYLYVHVEDFIVGFAVWSAFHCLQYYGIVWIYNSNRVRAGSPMTRFSRFLFRPRPALVLIYALTVLAYGALNYVQKFVYDETARRLLLALVATSSALHYYYDGFIWKVRAKETQRFLGIGSIRGALRRALPLGNRGLAQAGYLAAVVAALGVLETWRPNDELAVRQSVAAAAPKAEEGHLQLGEALRRQGRFAEALASYREAVRLKPGWAHAHVNLGVSLAALGRVDEAIGAYEQALSLDSGIPAAHYNVAVLLESKGLAKKALRHYRQALQGEDADARRLAASAIRQMDPEQ